MNKRFQKKKETGINTVLTIMPPKYYFFQAWHKGKMFFTLSIIQLVARRQYFTDGINIMHPAFQVAFLLCKALHADAVTKQFAHWRQITAITGFQHMAGGDIMIEPFCGLGMEFGMELFEQAEVQPF